MISSPRVIAGARSQWPRHATSIAPGVLERSSRAPKQSHTGPVQTRRASVGTCEERVERDDLVHLAAADVHVVGDGVGQLHRDRPDLAADAAEVVEESCPLARKLGKQRCEPKHVHRGESIPAPEASGALWSGRGGACSRAGARAPPCPGGVGNAATWNRERGAQLLDEALDCELAVAGLAALVLRDARRTGACTRDDTPFLDVGERGGRLDVEQGVDPRRGLLGVLSARAARARDAQRDLREREEGRERVTRIDSRSMACILLDIDGVLHVSGDPIPGTADAVAELRRAGHALRFVTNNSTRPRSRLAEELREMGFTLDDDELQTTPGAAARELAGKRVLALVMAAVVPDLDGLELVGDHAEAVLIGGCDETVEPNQVFSYMNLARAFAEIQMGASLYCLHKNKWWQTSLGPMLDSGAFVAGLEYATGVEATVLGKPSASYFAAALDALDAEPELTWLVTDDVDGDVRGARLFGMKTALVRTGKFRPEALEQAETSPDIVVSSLAQFPALLEEDLTGGWTP